MPTPRTRLAAGFAAWLAAVATALVVGLSAVGAIGTGLLGPSQQPLTPAEVDARLAATDPADPTPVDAGPADPTLPDPTPDEPATTPQVIATAGGTVLARCTAGRPEVVSAVPAQGFQVQTEDDDGGPRVRFRAGRSRFEIRVSCADGRAVADVRIDD